MGYEIREYLLEKWGRRCSYCHAEGVALQVEHIHPRSRGGSDRISNLCLACEPCNQEKSNHLLAEWAELLRKQRSPRSRLILANIPLIQKQVKQPLRDAAAVNSTRWALQKALHAKGWDVFTQSGGKTKMQRVQSGLPKTHYYDALSVGDLQPWKFRTDEVTLYRATGRGSRQMTRVDAYGFPKGHRLRQKTCQGFATGDIVRAVVTKGKKIGTYEGRVAIRHSGYFNIEDVKSGQTVQGISYKYCHPIQRGEGWAYSSKTRAVSFHD